MIIIKKKFYTFIFLFFFLFSLFFSNINTLAASNNEDLEDVLLTSNLIRNFKFDSFSGVKLNGSNQFAGGKLKFEMLPNWELKKENVHLVYEYTVGDRLYLYYKVALTNKINIYSNVKLVQATPLGLGEKETRLKVLDVIERPWWATTDVGFHTDTQYITYQHYDFGDIRTHNALENTFTGDLEMVFDIDKSPVPDALTDSEGNSHTKEFAYVAISSVAVENIDKGLMTENMPTIQGINAAEYKSKERKSYDASEVDTNAIQYDIHPDLDPLEEPTTTFGEALQFQSTGSSMNPMTKEGEDIWSPEDEKSMTDCRIRFNVGRISPMVYEWSSRLDYTYYIFRWTGCYGLLPAVLDKANPTEKSESRASALHVINRYAQVEIKAVFDIYSCFKIDTLENNLENYELARPQEYYDDLVWTSSVEGTTSGWVSEPAPWLDVLGFTKNWVTILVIVIVAIIALFIVVKVVMPIVKSKMERTNNAWVRPDYQYGPPPPGYAYNNGFQDGYNPPPRRSSRDMRTYKRGRRNQYYPY